eukprot:jgi/Picsp_1/2978/NSC_01202-R1_protein
MERRESERVEQVGSNGNINMKVTIAYCVVIADPSINQGCSTDPKLESSSSDHSCCSARRVSALEIVSMYDREGRYTQRILSQMLQFIGCKPRRADKVCKKIFLILEQRAMLCKNESCYGLSENLEMVHPGLFSVKIERSHFLQLVMDCLDDHPGKIHADAKMSNLRVACRIQERRDCVIILLCGTSGTGKSTLSSLVSSRLGISCVISTDAVRHMLRGFCSKNDAPAMWKSTYEASDVPTTDGASLETCFDRDIMRTYTHQSKVVLENVEHLVASYSYSDLCNYYSSHYDSQPDATSASSSVSAQRSTEGTNQELELGSILYPETSDDEKH